LRSVLPGLALAAILLSSSHALAEGKPLPPPASTAVPTVELTVTMDGDKPVCAPADLRLPADTNVTLHIVNRTKDTITLTMAGQFEKGRVLHTDGALFHVASEKGYSIKEGSQGTLKLRSIPAGEEEYGCTSTRNQQAPFRGKLITTPAAG